MKDFLLFVVIPLVVVGLIGLTIKIIVGDSNTVQVSSNDFHDMYVRDRNPATRL